MNFIQLLAILKARILPLLMTVAVAVGTAAALSWAAPYKYSSRTTVMLDFKSSNPFNVGFGAELPEGYFLTQIEAIRSPLVAKKVISRIDDETLKKLVVEATWNQQSMFSWLMAKITGTAVDFQLDVGALGSSQSIRERWADLATYAAIGNLLIDTVPGTRLITIEYRSVDPDLAATMANAFAEAYTITNLEMAVEPARRSSEWFGGHIELLRNRLEEAQQRLTAMQQAEKIVATDEKLDVETAKLNQLTSQLVTTRAAVRDALAKKAQMEQLLARGGALEELAEFQGNNFIQKLKSDLVGLERKLAELSEQLGKNHPKYQTAVAEIRDTQLKLDSEIKAVASGIRNRAALAEQQMRAEEAALAEQKNLVLDLKNQRDKISVLAREVESAQRVYEAALQRANDVQLESMVSQANVSIVEQALRNSVPVSPLMAQNILVAAVLGIMLGGGLAFFFEFVDRRVRTERDFPDLVGIPVLAVLERV